MRFVESFTWVHVLIISIVGGVLVGAAVYFSRPGGFTAESSLLLNDGPEIVAGTTGTDAQPAGAGSSLERLKAIVTSRALRRRVIDRLQLVDKLKTDRGRLVEDLLRLITIRTIGEDGLTVSVTVRGYARPRLALVDYPLGFEEARSLSAELANAVVDELDDYVREMRLERARDTLEFLEARESELSGELADTEDRLEALRAQYELLDPDSSATRLGERIRTLEQAQAEATAEADGAASSLEEAQSHLAATDVRRISSMVESRNPIISSLETELTNLRVQLATELARGKTDQHRDVVQIQSAIDSIEEQIAELQDEVLREIGEQPNPLHDQAVQRVVDLRVQLAGARARRAELSSLLAAARAEMSRLPAVAREYVSIQRDQQLRADQLAGVRAALWQARMEKERAAAEKPFTVLDEATPPIERRGPAWWLSGLIGFGALMLLQGLLVIDRRWFGG